MTMNWYALRVQSNREFGLADEIRRAAPGVDTYCPVFWQPVVYRGRQATLKRAMIPGYVFVLMGAGDMIDYHAVLSVRETIGWLGEFDLLTGDKIPTAIPLAAIHELKLIEADLGRPRKVEKGAIVAIVDGDRKGLACKVIRGVKARKSVILIEIDPATCRAVAAKVFEQDLASVVPLVLPKWLSGGAALKRAA